jgi:fibronectin type 3 domain-containing protein
VGKGKKFKWKLALALQGQKPDNIREWLEWLYAHTIPKPPSRLRGQLVEKGGDMAVVLAWKDNSQNEKGFNIYRSEEGGEFSLILTSHTDENQAADSNVTEGANYVYRVTAFNDAGESAASNEVPIKVPPGPVEEVPAAPSELTATSDAGAPATPRHR